jgi:hypothetical protein
MARRSPFEEPGNSSWRPGLAGRVAAALPGSRRAGVLAPARSFLLPQSVYARICTRLVACFVFGRRIVKIPSFMVAWTFSVSMSLGSTER